MLITTKSTCPFFLKTTNNQTKMASDKTYIKNINRYLWNEICDSSSKRLGNKSTRNKQKRQMFFKTLLFLKKNLFRTD